MEENRRLMGRVARGDEAAFTELVGRYGARLLGVARRLLGSRADAEDAVQRALLQCYLGAGSVGDIKPVLGQRRPWLRLLPLAQQRGRVASRAPPAYASLSQHQRSLRSLAEVVAGLRDRAGIHVHARDS